VNLGNATGRPSRIMDGSFANQVLAQMHLWEAKFADFGGVMTKLTTTQADYINVPFDGPFKPKSYKY